jgi:adenine deaminase
MATLNPAEHFGLAREIGQIAPGRWADVLLVRDLTDFQAGMVICKGQVIAADGTMTVALPPCEYPDWARASIHLPRPLIAEDFVLPVPGGAGQVQVNVIGVIEDQAPTQHLRLSLRANAGELHADPGTDLAKVALVERHSGSGRVTVGLVRGFGLGPGCAIASTVAHDCHHLIVIGTDETCMAQAANTLAESGGGQAVVRDGELLARVELNIAGIISCRPVGEVAAQASAVLEAFRACGCPLHNPNMQLSLLALPVIPELRITDRGLVDVNQFALIPVIE